MLDFFRKYQRFFFIIVTVVIIVTFSLFGSYRTMGQTQGRKDIVVGQAIDGSKLKYFEIKQLSQLLSSERNKESVIDKEFLQTGIAERLATAFYEPLQSDWQSRLDRAKRYHFYAHPAIASVNAEEIWNQLSPGIIDQVHGLQKVEDLHAFFALWAQLYTLQEHCSPDLIQRVILYYEHQLGLPRDPRVLSEDFALFGFHGAHDWFGQNFIDLISEFVINGAIDAKEKGFIVSREEALEDLAQRFTFKDASYEQVLLSLGVQKNEAIDLWQKVLGFLRYFHDRGEAVVIDDLTYRQFSDFANEAVRIDVYQLPAELRLSSLDDWLSYEVYAKIACSSTTNPLLLPTSLLSFPEVKERAPELVYSSYRFHLAEIDLSKMGSRLSMREVWDWQLAHWDSLIQAFPEVTSPSTIDHFDELEKLDPVRRIVVDDWSRRQMIESHPEWIEQELSTAEAKECTIAIYANGDIDNIEVHDVEAFSTLLDKASLDPEATNLLSAYRENEHIWRITNVEKMGSSILSFADAKQKGRIPVDRFLEQNRGDEFFGESKDDSIRRIFADVLQAVDRDEQASGNHPLSFYISHRFHFVMKDAIHNKKSQLSEERGLWNIDPTERTISRTSNEEWIMKQPFILKPEEWSDIYVPLNGDIVFFFVKERMQKSEPIFDQLEGAKETLSNDVKGQLAQQLLDCAMKKQAIVLPVKAEEETNDDL